jgi:hypothetical protein
VGSEKSSSFTRGQDGHAVGDHVAADRPRADLLHAGLVADLLAGEVADDVVPVALHVFVAHAELLGEELHQLHVEAVAAAGDEVGVGHAQVAQHAALADLVEVLGEGRLEAQQEAGDQKGRAAEQAGKR